MNRRSIAQCFALLGVYLLWNSDAWATRPMLQMSFANQDERVKIEDLCGIRATIHGELEMTFIERHILVRVLDECVQGRYGEVCAAYVINKESGECRVAPGLGDIFTILDYGLTERRRINNELPTKLKIPRRYIVGTNEVFPPILVNMKSGEAILFETDNEVRVFPLE